MGSSAPLDCRRISSAISYRVVRGMAVTHRGPHLKLVPTLTERPPEWLFTEVLLEARRDYSTPRFGVFASVTRV